MSRILVTLVLLASSVSAFADEWQRVLIPIYFKGEVAGAYGSRWVTDLSGFNASGAHQRLSTNPARVCTRPSECADYVMPGEFIDGDRFIFTDRPGEGRLAYVMTAIQGVDLEDKLRLTLHVRDLSREAESHGVQVPVITEKDTFSAGWSFGLPNVPMGANYRQKLRLYDFDGELGHTVTVQFWRTYTIIGNDSQLLATRTVTLGNATDAANPYPGYPGFAQLDLDTMPELIGQDSVSIRVKPESEGHFWGFVTVTNNETQRVTTIAP
ncbi:MAG TPA: hypothetical protein VFN10_07795 [Thermoanaerobaculia bacterium]|nr:hypothetical protein [Thermoanaerobaculia bacterium]